MATSTISDKNDDIPPAKRQKTATSKEGENENNNNNNNNNNNASSGFNAASHVNNQSDLKQSPFLTPPLLPRDAKVLLLDIEGCTTSISFVHDVLFPFALSNLPNYLNNEDRTQNDLQDILNGLKDDVSKLDSDHPSKIELEKINVDETSNNIKDDICKYVKALMNHDVKATHLKALQGKIWKNGYASSELKGHIYQDFQPMLQWCKDQNVSVNIYSSGSIGAQKLLFGHSLAGDLCHYFNGHFDTTSGGKKESKSYQNIADSLGINVEDLCFVSDAEAELVAAREAGVGYVVMSVRPGNEQLTEVGKEFPIVYSLLQLCGSGQ
jgi:2,3-diketo-5-methylthio-1-phosphopentane phosphatase